MPHPYRSPEPSWLSPWSVKKALFWLASVACFSIVLRLRQVPEPQLRETLAPEECFETRVPVRHVLLPVFDRLEEFLEGPVGTTGGPAVCTFLHDKISIHFPHAMQQLYSCWSYWQANPKPWVLNIVDAKPTSILERLQYAIYERRNQDNPFLTSFGTVLTNVFGVEVVHNQQYETSVQAKRMDPWLDGYAMKQGDHHTLRDALVPNMKHCPRQPRIAILNREKNRALSNVEHLQDWLQRAFQVPVPIVYFEGKSFAEQVEFFAQTDILLSPHGAQLTGLPFMPRCGGILEVFPDGYLIPKFFGSLAEASELHHAFLYMGDNRYSVEEIQALDMQDAKARSRSRQANLCPSAVSVHEGLTQLMEQWQQCCVEL